MIDSLDYPGILHYQGCEGLISLFLVCLHAIGRYRRVPKQVIKVIGLDAEDGGNLVAT